MSTYNPYALKIGDTDVLAQVRLCVDWTNFNGVFLVFVGGVNGTEGYTPGAPGAIAPGYADRAYEVGAWVLFNVIGDYDSSGPGSGLLIDNIRPFVA